MRHAGRRKASKTATKLKTAAVSALALGGLLLAAESQANAAPTSHSSPDVAKQLDARKAKAAAESHTPSLTGAQKRALAQRKRIVAIAEAEAEAGSHASSSSTAEKQARAQRARAVAAGTDGADARAQERARAQRERSAKITKMTELEAKTRAEKARAVAKYRSSHR
ncbi:hypothetical protein ACFZCY_04005 [Streptomyces sp. NPDC007983]|uniref:hypothetical protein n=1 Tax=Streptomyces sp. NPDC007983 TaxID=3364800 RepID=UPI0036E01BE1